MFRNRLAMSAFVFLCTIFSAAPMKQVNAATPPNFAPPPAVPQITQSINPAQLSPMQTGVRPEATAANDLGAVANDFALNDMLLLLHRPDASEQALDAFMAEQTTPGSPNYHHWLTAEQVGEFGPAQSDINTIVSWLQSQGFTINRVHADGMMIDFSGTAGQVRQAFHTEVDNLNVDGVAHIANMSVPEIPSALVPAVVGIVSIDDFKLHANFKPKPAYTFGSGPTYAVVPADLATIYNFGPLFSAGVNGTGQTIALIEDEDPYSTADFDKFRSTFGLPAFVAAPGYPSYTAVHPSCTDPGDSGDGTDEEIALDVEYAGASAPYAALQMVSCGDSGTSTFGGLIAMQNLNSANDPTMLWSLSYGDCEAANGASRNAAYVSTYQTAAARGVSVFVASGDEGAASCDANRLMPPRHRCQRLYARLHTTFLSAAPISATIIRPTTRPPTGAPRILRPTARRFPTSTRFRGTFPAPTRSLRHMRKASATVTGRAMDLGRLQQLTIKARVFDDGFRSGGPSNVCASGTPSTRKRRAAVAPARQAGVAVGARQSL